MADVKDVQRAATGEPGPAADAAGRAAAEPVNNPPGDVGRGAAEAPSAKQQSPDDGPRTRTPPAAPPPADDSLKQVLDGVSGASTDSSDPVTALARGTLRSIKDGAGDAGRSARQAYERTLAAGRRWESRLEGDVKEKPLQSILIALGIGVLLALVWKD